MKDVYREYVLLVNCPVGSFFNVVDKKCELCHQGSYQSEEAQMTCLVCPENSSTGEGKVGKKREDCKGKTFHVLLLS